MNRRLVGIVAGGIVLVMLVIAVSYQRAQAPEAVPMPGEVATSSPQTPSATPTGTEGTVPAAETTGTQLAVAPQQAAPASLTTDSARLTGPVPEATATLVVQGTNYALTAPAGSTLKEAMDTLATESSFTYAYRSHAGLGAFVTQINGRASDGDHYWILYVNGEQSATGISSTRVRSGDLIEWRLDKSF